MMQNVIVWLWHGYIYIGIRTDVLEWDPQKSGPQKSRPLSSLLWAGGRDNEEHGATQEMLNCISQDSAAGTRGREGENTRHTNLVPSQKAYKQLKIADRWMLSYVL